MLLDNIKISVAMATYNGEKFIREQLESIINQTRRPDEIVISDDGSTDKTLAIVNEIKDKYNDVEFIVVNGNFHSPTLNFENAIKHTTGDYIFLSDQDDIWKDIKVETVITEFLKHSDCNIITHKTEVIGPTGLIPNTLFNYHKEVGDNKEYLFNKENYLETCINVCYFPGMCMCLKREFMEKTLPFPNVGIAFDKWLQFCAIVVADEKQKGGNLFLNTVLTTYRVHTNNASGGTNIKKIQLKKLQKSLKRCNVKNIYHQRYEGRLYQREYEYIVKYLPQDKETQEFVKEKVETINKLGMVLCEGKLKAIKELCYLWKNNKIYGNFWKKSYQLDLLQVLLNSKRARKRQNRRILF